MPAFDAVDQPIAYLIDRAHSNHRMILAMQEDTHWLRSGNFDLSAATAAARDRFIYDGKWPCIDCRKASLEKKEGKRILEGFDGHEMFVTVLEETDEERVEGSLRDLIRRRASKIDVQYVAIPIFTGSLVVFTTAPFEESSEHVTDTRPFISDTVMAIRWKFPEGAGITSSKGFLPPARRQDYFEAYRKEPSDRCWHLHRERDEARECAGVLSLESHDGRRWYTRPTSEWHQAGKLKVYGAEALRVIADQCGIMFVIQPSQFVAITFEPLIWDDPRLQRFLRLAGWQPPHPNWTPPPLEVQLRAVRGRFGARAASSGEPKTG